MNINKRSLWRQVNKKINKKINSNHVYAVINILFEEIINDLINNKPIIIDNFFTMKLSEESFKKHYNIVLKKISVCKNKRKINIKISPKLKTKLIHFLDIDETIKLTKIKDE